MHDTPRSETTASPPPSPGPVPREGSRGLLWVVLAVAIAFLAGFGWQFYEASTVRGELSVVEQELALERLRVHLGQAAMSAQSGDFERARQQMSTFFSQLQQTSDAVDPEIQGIADDFLSMRDQVITALSRSNPEYGAVLYGMHQRLSAAIDRSLHVGQGSEADGSIDGTDSDPGQE